MLQQQVDYDFAVYRLPMPTDVPVTILTVGRSLLHAAVDLELILNTAGKNCLHGSLNFCYTDCVAPLWCCLYRVFRVHCGALVLKLHRKKRKKTAQLLSIVQPDCDRLWLIYIT